MSAEFWRMGATPVPCAEIGRFAREFEASGWDGLAVGEAHGLLPDPYAVLAARGGGDDDAEGRHRRCRAAARIRCSRPSAMATLQGLSRGRAASRSAAATAR